MLLAACGGKSAQDCKVETDAMAPLLQRANAVRPPFLDEGIELPLRTTTRQPVTYEGGVLLEGKDTLSMYGREATVEDLASARARAHGPTPDRIFVAADARMPWKAVLAGLDAATDAGFTEVVFVFRSPDPLPTPPPHTHVTDDVAKFTSVTDIASYASKLVKPCPSLTKLFGQVGAGDGDKSAIIIAGAGPAIAECGCAVSPAEVTSLLWGIIAPRYMPAYVTMPLGPRGSISNDPAELWGAASARLR